MRKGKILQGTLVLAAAAAVSVGVSATDASASQITIGSVSINTMEQTLTIGPKCDAEVAVGVATVKAVKDKATGNSKNVLTPAADAAWDWYDNTAAVTVDLSSLVNTKDNYIQIKGNSKTDPITIKIPAVDTTVSGKFNAGTGKVEITHKVVKDTVKLEVSDVPFEYKTSYGAWTAFTDSVDLSRYQQKGASLTFRARAVIDPKVAVAAVTAGKQTLTTGNQTTTTIKATNTLDIYANADATVQENIYVSYPFSGKEFKVAIAKLANAPKVTINYLNDTLTIPKGAEYRLVGTTLGTWKGAGDGTAVTTDTAVNTAKAITLRTERTLNDIGMVAASGVAPAARVEVRTAAVEEQKNDEGKITVAAKAASKWSGVDFNALEMIRTNTTGKSSSTVANLKPIGGSAIASNWVGTATKIDGTGGTLDVTVKCDAAKKAGTYDLVFTNNTADKYQIVVENPESPVTDTKGNVTGYNYKYYLSNTALTTSKLPPIDVSIDIANDKKVNGKDAIMGTRVSVKNIPAAKTAKDATTGEMKVTAPSTFKLNAPEGAQIFIAKTGDAKTGTWTTRYLPLGTVK